MRPTNESRPESSPPTRQPLSRRELLGKLPMNNPFISPTSSMSKRFQSLDKVTSHQVALPTAVALSNSAFTSYSSSSVSPGGPSSSTSQLLPDINMPRSVFSAADSTPAPKQSSSPNNSADPAPQTTYRSFAERSRFEARQVNMEFLERRPE